MKVHIRVWLLLAIIVPFAATAQDQTEPDSGAGAAAIDPGTSKQIFDQMCAGCHGTEGNGQEGTKSGFVPRIGTLANKVYMASVPDDYLVMIVKKGGDFMGKIATMPAWEKRLTDEEIRGLVVHMRTFTK